MRARRLDALDEGEAMTEKTFRAIGQTEFGGPEVLKLVSVPRPECTGSDLLVRMRAVGVNPVDPKVRENWNGYGELQNRDLVVTGWDGAGVVEKLGPDADGRFRVGDEVFFCGNIARRGCNAELALVDSRIVGRKPKSLSFAGAAALPLTALTAWECLIEGCAMSPEPRTGTALVVGGAGGVGSIGIQILKRLMAMTVVATASRPESTEHCKRMGADAVIDHRRSDLKEQLGALGISSVNVVLNTSDPNNNYTALASVLAPLGKICCILPMTTPVDLSGLFAIRGSLIFELVFHRVLFGVDVDRQGAILDRVSALVDDGKLATTLVTELPWTVDDVREAHRRSDSGRTIGKTVLVMP
jgi:NADPH2:quinone reductase